MLRLLILAEAPSLAGSSRVLCYQYKPFLDAAGVIVDIVAPVNNQLYAFLLKPEMKRGLYGRIERRLLTNFYRYVVVPVKRIEQLMRANKYDIVVVQRSLWYTGSPALFERILRKYTQCLVYNFDDALFVQWPESTRERIELADAIWTGNELLADYARQFNHRVKVIEAGVDTDNYYPPKQSYELHAPPIIGWVGNPSNLKHLKLLEEPLLALKQRIDFRFRVISSRPYEPTIPNLPVDFIPWSLEQEVSNLTALDIGVMPLHNDPYTRGKEGFKLKQYMACGLPCVASPVGYNTKLIVDNTTGHLASTPEEWTEKLYNLLTDIQLRQRLGQNGREFIVEHYATSGKALELKDFFTQLSTKTVALDEALQAVSSVNLPRCVQQDRQYPS